jgi:NAD(P)-dependent dehydrogenase (short-subunit alcohol dehydrogenase family)
MSLAAQGIGRAVALRLADDGYTVAVNDVGSNSEKLDSLVDEIQNKGRASSKYVADVSLEGEVKDMVEQVVRDHGGLDVVSRPPFLYPLNLLIHGRWLQMPASGDQYASLSLKVSGIVQLCTHCRLGSIANSALKLPASAEEWDRVMSVNARGPFLCYKYAGLQMIKQGRGGRIIGASSFSGKQGKVTRH